MHFRFRSWRISLALLVAVFAVLFASVRCGCELFYRAQMQECRWREIRYHEVSIKRFIHLRTLTLIHTAEQKSLLSDMIDVHSKRLAELRSRETYTHADRDRDMELFLQCESQFLTYAKRVARVP